MIKKLNIRFITVVLIAAFATMGVFAQNVENDFEYRTSFKLSFKPVKKLKLSFTPEVRFKDDFSIDRYLMETELVYKPFSHFYLGGGYRFIVNPRSEKDTEYLHRYELSAAYKKKFDRFLPELKIRYTNYADDDEESNFFRYKATLGYNIPKCKLTPAISAELFQQLSNGEMYKVRYKLQLDYKLFKHNYVGISYRFDYYLQKEKNNHIFSLGYKIKL